MVLKTILEDAELGFNRPGSKIKPKTSAEATARSYLPNMRVAANLVRIFKDLTHLTRQDHKNAAATSI